MPMVLEEHWQGSDPGWSTHEFTKYGLFILPREFMETGTLVQHCLCARVMADDTECSLHARCTLSNAVYVLTHLVISPGRLSNYKTLPSFLLFLIHVLCRSLKPLLSSGRTPSQSVGGAVVLGVKEKFQSYGRVSDESLIAI